MICTHSRTVTIPWNGDSIETCLDCGSERATLVLPATQWRELFKPVKSSWPSPTTVGCHEPSITPKA